MVCVCSVVGRLCVRVCREAGEGLEEISEVVGNVT